MLEFEKETIEKQRKETIDLPNKYRVEIEMRFRSAFSLIRAAREMGLKASDNGKDLEKLKDGDPNRKRVICNSCNRVHYAGTNICNNCGYTRFTAVE